jgi:hypothetical protein
LSAQELNRRLLLFAARTVADARPLRDPRNLGPALVRGARGLMPGLVRAVRGAVRLALLLLSVLAGATMGLVRRLGRALVAVYRWIDFRAVGRVTLGAVAVAGAGLLIAADLSTVRQVTVVTVVDGRVRGGPEHYYALLALGLCALPLAWGAARGRSRPAMRALAAIGLAAVAIGLAVDLPKLGDTGSLGVQFDKAHGGAGPGFARELGGGALLLLAGVGLLRLTPRPRRGARRGGAPELAVGSPPAAPAA